MQTNINSNTLEGLPWDSMVNTPVAARFLGVKPRCLEQYRIKGGGPVFVRLSSRCVRYRIRDLQTYIHERLQNSTAEY
jgi:hypothetical protein